MSLSHKDLTTPFLEHKVELSPATKFFKKITKPAENETVDFDVAITPSVYPQDIRSEIANIELAIGHLLFLQKKISKGNKVKGITGFTNISLTILLFTFLLLNISSRKKESDTTLSHTFIPGLNTTCSQFFQVDCSNDDKNFYNETLAFCHNIANEPCRVTGLGYATIVMLMLTFMFAVIAISNIQGYKFETILKDNNFVKKWDKTDFIKEILAKYKISLGFTLDEIIGKLYQEKEKLQTDNEKVDEIKINYERRLS